MRGFFWFLLLRAWTAPRKGQFACLSRPPLVVLFFSLACSLFSLSNPNSLSSLQIVPCSIKSTHPWVSSSQPQKEEERLGKLSGFLFLFVFRPFLTLRFFLKKKSKSKSKSKSKGLVRLLAPARERPPPRPTHARLRARALPRLQACRFVPARERVPVLARR